MIWEVESDTRGWTSYLIDTATGQTELLKSAGIAKYEAALAPMEPVSFPSRDGLTLNAYLTRPRGVEGPVPTVIMIHGGPVSRTLWGWNSIAQWLANRGYAVLDVNYRGSSGYGRAFRKALYGEVSRAEHDDIVQARAWAVANGIADPSKVAVFGGSWGGLKVLTALTRDPELFAAGVNINGVSDLVSLIDEMPPYWTEHLFDALMGGTASEMRSEMKARSPIHALDQIEAPLLTIQGSNDVRVLQSQSDRLMTGLQAAGKDAEYMLIEGAGHTFANMTWQQHMMMHRRIERFLAQHLGGRADGFDYAVLGAQIIP